MIFCCIVRFGALPCVEKTMYKSPFLLPLQSNASQDLTVDYACRLPTMIIMVLVVTAE